jgi:serine/threonine protein kinase
MGVDDVHARVTEALHRVLELPLSEREGYIRRSYSDDPELIGELASLLSQSDGPIILDHPVTTVSGLIERHHRLETEPFPLIPGFQISRMLGEGSSSIVYLADQTNPSRKVAIKVLRSSSASPEGVDRIRAEAHFLARLDHPSISRVFEVGILEGPLSVQPYIVMEYVSGVAITTYVREKQCTWAEKILLISMLCDTVHHAHQLGIFHRDLKPSNVLVQSDAVSGHSIIKVIDFGIAKLAGGVSLPIEPVTLDSRSLGTMRYMSPERLRGEAVGGLAAGDIYSLGITIAEFFEFPLEYRVGQAARLQRSSALISERWIQRRSYRRVRGLIERMLDPCPKRRPISAHLVAAEIRGERRETWVARSSTSMRRILPTSQSSLLFAFLIVVVIGTIGVRSVFLPWWRGRLVQYPGGALESPGGFELALEGSTGSISYLNERERHERISARIQLVTNLTVNGRHEEAISVCEELFAWIGDLEVLSQERRSAVLVARGFTLLKAGRLDESETWYRKARENVSLVEDFSNKMVNRWFDVAHGLQSCGDLETASMMYSELIEHPAFGNLPWEFRCRILGGIAGLHWLQGQMSEAEKHFKEAIESPPYPGEIGDHITLAERESSLGVVLRDQNRFTEASVYLSRGLDRAMRFRDPSSPLVCRLAFNLAMNCVHAGEFERARKLIKQVRREWSIQPESLVSELCEADLALAIVEINSGQVEEARDRVQAALGRAKDFESSSDRLILCLENTLGAVLCLDGEYESGIDMIRQSHDSLLRLYGPDHPWVHLSAARIERYAD